VVHKIYYDNIHEETRHAVGDWVWLSLHQRATASHQAPTPGKLKPHFYGPYRNAAIINDVTYRLELLACARMQDVFHVGLLKKFVGAPPTTPPALPSIHHGAAVLEPEPVACAKSSSIGRANLLHQLHGRTSSASATATPHFQLEDELLVEERDVMWGRVYQQRGSKKGANEADTASTDGTER